MARPRHWVSSTAYKLVVAKLIELRTKSGMTQRELAAAISKSPSVVAKIEMGERRIDILEFVAIVRALGAKETDVFRSIAVELPKRIEI